MTDVRSFIRLAGYYRRFIEGFSKVAHAITSLQKKGVKFEWTLKYEESFQRLKNILTNAPILKVADPGNILWYVLMHADKGLEESLCRTTM